MRDDSFYKRLMDKGITEELKGRMQWINRDENPAWRPDDSDMQCGREIMDLAYRRRLLLSGGGDELQEEKRKANAELRSRQFEAFVRLFPFKWTSGSAQVLGHSAA